MKRKILIGTAITLAAVLLIMAGIAISLRLAHFGYAAEVPPEEREQRDKVISTAEAWLGCMESDNSHRPIIDIYNAHQPLAQGYLVQYDDQWCATFVSAVAIQCGLTDIIPTECGCQRQIALFEALGCWQEDDGYFPLPGDIIYYCNSDTGFGDCTGWSDHVGIVVGTWGRYIKVIEGNVDGTVQYRYIRRNAASIRGYATPDYGM